MAELPFRRKIYDKLLQWKREDNGIYAQVPKPYLAGVSRALQRPQKRGRIEMPSVLYGFVFVNVLK